MRHEHIPGTESAAALFHPYVGQDVPRLLEARASDRADHTFIVWAPFDGEAERWSYARFAREVRRLAAGLKARGVKPRDFVVLHMENCPEFLLSWHACSRLGAVVVTTNNRSSEDEVRYFIDHCGARFAITQPRFENLIRNAGPGSVVTRCTIMTLSEAPRGLLPFCARPTPRRCRPWRGRQRCRPGSFR